MATKSPATWHSEAIQRNLVTLAEDLELDGILGRMLRDDLMTSDTSDGIKNNYVNISRGAKNEAFLDWLCRDLDGRIGPFLLALEDTKQPKLATLITDTNKEVVEEKRKNK